MTGPVCSTISPGKVQRMHLEPLLRRLEPELARGVAEAWRAGEAEADLPEAE